MQHATIVEVADVGDVEITFGDAIVVCWGDIVEDVNAARTVLDRLHDRPEHPRLYGTIVQIWPVLA